MRVADLDWPSDLFSDGPVELEEKPMAGIAGHEVSFNPNLSLWACLQDLWLRPSKSLELAA